MATDKWAGFTDEDLQKIKNKSPSKDNFEPMKYDPISGAFKQPYEKDDGSDTEVGDLTTDPPKTDAKAETVHTAENANGRSSESGLELSDDSCASSDCSRKEEAVGEKRTHSEINIHELELFEIRQKRIESENARRRALINRAINDKKLRTQAEAAKLQHITRELNRLDSLLSADVSILRNYIEIATKEFREAEKTYFRVEREYVEAKLNLFEKLQKKQQLTEHLCAIIEQTENRKANKLVELMKQLEMETVADGNDMNDSQPILAEFCAINEEAYQCCQTLKPPTQPADQSNAAIETDPKALDECSPKKDSFDSESNENSEILECSANPDTCTVKA